MRTKMIIVIVLSAFLAPLLTEAQAPWPPERADARAANHPWLVGCNFAPSTAINQLEMWQAETFDPVTIDRELGWAEGIGFNSVRVFLHDLLWQQDSHGFLRRMDQVLAIAHRHHIGLTFVLFDSCWNPNPALGKQPAPKPYVHNSGWVQSPGRDRLEHPESFAGFKPYVQGVIGHFRKDSRIDLWDVFNEPDNADCSAYLSQEAPNKKELALVLIQMTFAWAREVGPSQPLTSGVWRGDWADPDKLSPMERVQLQNSDVISFHSYSQLDELKRCVEHLQRFHRPIVCTEYRARPVGSTFDPNLKYLRDQHVGAYNWGFVSGKTQTIYPGDSWTKSYTAEPPLWFHDIFRRDGQPYDTRETEFIKSVTKP